MKPIVEVATERDAPAIARLRAAVAAELTRRHGRGHWSSAGTERGALHAINASRVLVARAWPADAIRLDAYEGPAGAGDFYVRCGYREVGRARYRGVALVYFELPLG